MATIHYPIGGSNVELAELCPGSVKARQERGNKPAGAAADRGTRIHSYVELIWTQTFTGRKLAKEEKDLIKTLSEDERQIGIAFVETLKLLATKYGFEPSEVNIEQQFSFQGELAGGTPDAFAIKAFGDMIMIDFKTGYRQVSAAENLQLLFYICAILRNIDAFTAETVENVHLIILQSDSDAPIIHTKTWTTSREELAKYDGRFAGIVQNVIDNPDTRTAGEHCENMYCPVRATCAQHTAYQNERSNGRLEAIQNGQEVEIVTGVNLADALRANVGLKKFAKSLLEHCETIEADAKNVLRTSPTAIPGWTLADSVGHRAWTNEKEVEKRAKDLGLKSADIKNSKLLSPAQMEKLIAMRKLDGGFIEELTVKPITGQTLKEGQAISIEERFLAAV